VTLSLKKEVQLLIGENIMATDLQDALLRKMTTMATSDGQTYLLSSKLAESVKVSLHSQFKKLKTKQET
jgi:hypothetical protein